MGNNNNRVRPVEYTYTVINPNIYGVKVENYTIKNMDADKLIKDWELRKKRGRNKFLGNKFYY